MLDTNFLLMAGWSSLTVCAIWYFTAKYSAPITISDAKLIWAIHKRNDGCESHNWKPITRRKGKIVGFQCACGYKYTQKRPLASRMLKHV